MRVFLPEGVRRRVIEHALREYPNEACGLLAGVRDRDGSFNIRAAYPTRNSAESPIRYEINPDDMYHALMDAESRGLEILGAYHSHPLGQAVPSRMDEERAHPGFLYVIVSVPKVRVRAFIWHRGEGFVELLIVSVAHGEV